MTILESELKLYKSSVVDDTAANGGRMSANLVVSGVSQNVWPNVFKAERDAGSTKYRKLFFKVANDADETGLAAGLHVFLPTAGGDHQMIFAATQRDTQGDITGSERKYGCAYLQSDAAAGSSTLVVTVEDASLTGMYQSGDTVRVTQQVTLGGAGNLEDLVIASAPVVVGNQVTITTTTLLVNSYTVALGGRVAAIYSFGNVQCTVDNWVETSAAGTYDEGVFPLIMDNIGTVEQTWTRTHSDATSFTVSGDTLGAVGSGTIGVNFSPINPDFSKPYFTLEALGNGGTWASGDTIVFQTHPAVIPFWEKRVVPPGCASLSGNKVTVAVELESA